MKEEFLPSNFESTEYHILESNFKTQIHNFNNISRSSLSHLPSKPNLIYLSMIRITYINLVIFVSEVEIRRYRLYILYINK